VPSTTRNVVSALCAALMLAGALPAYDYPLTQEAVREAYFIGQRHDQSTRDLLAKYVKRLPPSKTPWQVTEVEVRTPYQQVVLRAQQALNYSAQRAWEDYRKSDPRVIVRLYMLAPVAKVLTDENEWRSFRYRVEQTKEIAPLSVHGWPVYSVGNHGMSTVIGAEVHLELPLAEVSSAPLRVEVKFPSAQVASATFDLSRVR
jgi:hypothetical protein